MTDPLVALVDKATSEYLVQTDWTVVLQICDSLNRENNPLGCRDVLRQATKKMKEKKTRVAMYALELIETLVKNCECMHSYVGGKEFQAELIKLIQNKKTKDAVRNRALELVQYWADSFQTRRDLPLFNQTHLLLRRSGINFPARRTDEPPLVFKNVPHAAVPDRRDHRTTPPRQDSASAGLKDFNALQENVNLAMEMLAYTNPEEEDPSTNEILKDLINTCKEAGPNVRSAIENGPSESQMVTLLALNDELVKVQEMFDDLVARRQLFLKHGPQPKKAPAATAPSPNFIDLADAFGPLSLSGPQQPQHHHTNAHVTTTSSNPLGDLDFLSMPSQPAVHAPLPPSDTGYATQPVVIGYTNSTGYSNFPAPPAQQPYITTIHQPTATSYPPQPQPYVSPTKTPVAGTQAGAYVNPFLSSGPAQPTPAKQGGGSADPFDEFDMLASSRHPAPAPVPLAAPLQPIPSAKPAPQTPPSLYFPPSNPAPSANIPLVPAPANGLYMNTNNAPRASSPMNPMYSTSAPLSTSPTNPQQYGYPQTGPGVGMGAGTGMGTNPFLSTYPAQPMQPLQPMQPMQPNYNTSYPAYNPLQAGGYRPQ